VKHGYPDEVLARHLARKYGREAGAALEGANRLIVVVDSSGRGDWSRRLQEVSGGLAPGLAVEVWDEEEFLRRLRECFGIEVESITTQDLIDVRHAIDRAKGFHAFGAPSWDEYEHDPLKEELLWHFGFWRLRELRERRGFTPREMLVPGVYRNVVVVLADMCSFSSFMRDTPDAEVTRESLTTFYSMARDQIINRGGMLYQFVGDEVIGMFGIPEQDEDGPTRALAVARSLLSVGASVSHHWQRHIDRVQPSGGLHIGMALGDVQIVSLRRTAARTWARSATASTWPRGYVLRGPGGDRRDELPLPALQAPPTVPRSPRSSPRRRRTSGGSAPGRRASRASREGRER
jgi:hypothetical protein